MSEPAAPAPARKTTPRGTWTRIMAVSGVGFALALVNIATNSEEPSQVVMILQYLGLGLGGVGLVGGLIGFLSAR